MRFDTQLEASRRNGARSLGPLSPDGKDPSSRNAITRGLSAHDALLRLQQLRQFHPPNSNVPGENGLEIHFRGNEPKKS